MDCPECQTPLPANARFCLHCGSKVLQVLTCRECGTELPEGSKFCMSCGAMQGDINVVSRTASVPAQKVAAGGTAARARALDETIYDKSNAPALEQTTDLNPSELLRKELKDIQRDLNIKKHGFRGFFELARRWKDELDDLDESRHTLNMAESEADDTISFCLLADQWKATLDDSEEAIRALHLAADARTGDRLFSFQETTIVLDGWINIRNHSRDAVHDTTVIRLLQELEGYATSVDEVIRCANYINKLFRDERWIEHLLEKAYLAARRGEYEGISGCIADANKLADTYENLLSADDAAKQLREWSARFFDA